VRNEGDGASLEQHEVYRVVCDLEADKKGDVRAVDESGEDWLCPAEWLISIEVPEAVQHSLPQAS